MYHVYLNQAAAAYSLLYFFISLSLQSSTLNFFVTLFSGTVRPRLKLGTPEREIGGSKPTAAVLCP